MKKNKDVKPVSPIRRYTAEGYLAGQFVWVSPNDIVWSPYAAKTACYAFKAADNVVLGDNVLERIAEDLRVLNRQMGVEL